MAKSAQATKTAREAYCPHCFLLVDQNVAPDWPEQPTRCPHCRLLIGPGRGRPTPEANPGARGSAAGVFAHQAKRDDGDDSLPTLSEVFSAFGSWKRARREAAA